MRVVNDREQRTETSEVGFLSILTHALMVSFGVATLAFAPIPMILSHEKLLEPWCKVAVVAGSLLALLVLEVPLAMVVFSFVFGLFIADSVSRKPKEIWHFLGSASLVALGVFALVLVTESSFERMNVVQYWNQAIDGFIQQMTLVMQVGTPVEWDLVRGLLLYEGPFLVVSGAIFSAWVSVGICAHAGWLTEKNAFSANALRNLTPSLVLSIGFLVALLAARFSNESLRHLFSGIARVFAALLFVQGTVVLSRWMAARGIRMPLRSLFYCFSVVLGFYALIGIGFVSPLLLKKKSLGVAPQSIALTKSEEVV